MYTYIYIYIYILYNEYLGSCAIYLYRTASSGEAHRNWKTAPTAPKLCNLTLHVTIGTHNGSKVIFAIS